MSFLQAVGHDIRTPLTSIDTTMQLLSLEAATLSETELRARVAEAARSVRSACGFGLAMSNDVFELIRSDGGKWRASPAAVDLMALIDDACAIIAPRAREKSLAVACTLDGCTRPDLAGAWTDPVRLTQSLVNVLTNAVKFSDEGCIEIVVAMPASGEIAIEVRDSGPGIDEAAIDRLFEPFHQSERTAARSGEGLGLGLAIADRCARLLGGRWTAANRTDRTGAVFTLTLPLRCPLRATAGSTAAGNRATASLRVLVVDDAVDASRLAEHHLASLGHTVTAVPSVAHAETLLGSAPFDLVLTDFELPDGTAADLVRKAGRTPVLVSSAHPHASVTCAGSAGTVPKPVTRASLEAAIGRVLAAFPTSATPSS